MTIFLALLLAAPLRAGDSSPALVFISGGKEALRLTAEDLAKRPGARTVEVRDPFYKSLKRYKAVALKDLLTAAYGGAWSENALSEVFFDALDGYRSHVKVSVLMNDGGMLAFADADAPDWRPMPQGALPGPFYLVWTGPEQTKEKGFPWPWQLARVKMAVLEDEYPRALPHGAAPDSAAGRGWTTFKRSCLSCHSMNGDGGTVGPDLNAPRGITRYQDKRFLKPFIRKASSYRRTKMPDFEDLGPAELNELMAYFDHMSDISGTK
ncbi:MAG: cytochrome c [Elusimicrobia bacterium]|nr:cytochrome c [Elusimicrobiota bacterium]